MLSMRSIDSDGEIVWRNDCGALSEERQEGCPGGKVNCKSHFPRAHMAEAAVTKEIVDDFNTIFRARRLFQQYVVDAAATIEQNRLTWYINNQRRIRADMYKGLEDGLSLDAGEDPDEVVGRRVVRPPSPAASGPCAPRCPASSRSLTCWSWCRPKSGGPEPVLLPCDSWMVGKYRPAALDAVVEYILRVFCFYFVSYRGNLKYILSWSGSVVLHPKYEYLL
jgi:Helitron helicase-like domain at N-terminus